MGQTGRLPKMVSLLLAKTCQPSRDTLDFPPRRQRLLPLAASAQEEQVETSSLNPQSVLRSKRSTAHGRPVDESGLLENVP